MIKMGTVLSFELLCLGVIVMADSVYITTPKRSNHSGEPTSIFGPHDCVNESTMRIFMDTTQESAIENKRISLSAYEYVRDVLTHVSEVKTMIRTVVEKEMILSNLVSQVLNEQDNAKDYFPHYASTTNSRLFALETKQIVLQEGITEMKEHLDVRLNKIEEMITASTGLSRNAIISYSLVALVSLAVILAASLWCISHFAINANPETPFIQRLAHSVWRVISPHMHSSVIVQASSAPSEMPPSYSTVDITMAQSLDG